MTDRADHRGYIDAVCQALTAAGIGVGKRAFGEGRVRTATVHLIPPPEGDPEVESWAQTFTSALNVLLCWSEEQGWFLVAPTVRGGNRVASPWFKGFGVLPPPDDVATWVELLLMMPHSTVSMDDGPYRQAAHADPDFEARLAAFRTSEP